jgi:hypothetical protein
MIDQHDDRPHAIRLSTVWEPPAAGGNAWVRRFGCPAGIEPGVAVVLVIDGAAVAAVTLNGVALAGPSPECDRWACDVTSLLAERNLLRIEPAPGVGEGGALSIDAHGRASLPAAIGCVRLEILTPPQTER